ncbi:MAG: amidohydrolase family protein [Cyclobacteriaceae bacterium]
MRIDSHQHFWKYDPVKYSWIEDNMQTLRRDFLPADLAPLLKQKNIHGSVAVQADQSEGETEFLLGLAGQNDIVKGVVGWVDLLVDGVEERLEHFSKNKYLKGIRHIVQSEPNDFMLRKDFQNGIMSLAQFDLVYDILVFPPQLIAAIALVQKFPDQYFVLDHIAKPYIKDSKISGWKEDIKELAHNPKVYCKLSGMVTEADWNDWKEDDFRQYLDVIVEAFGTDRLMYGSDWPVSLLAAQYEKQYAIVENYISQFSQEEQANIMGNTAAKFYKL